MGEHICTDESLAFRDEKGEMQRIERFCEFCSKKRSFVVTYVDLFCPECGLRVYEGYGCYLLKKIRKYHKISRKDWGKIFGLKPSTITTYECGNFCEIYYQKVIAFHKKKRDKITAQNDTL